MKIKRFLTHKLIGAIALNGIALAACAASLTETQAAAATETNAIYAAPDGRESAAGTIDDPLTIFRAVQKVSPGETIYVRGGVYKLTDKRVNLDKIGTAEQPIRLFAYRDEKPVLDCIGLELGKYSRNGIRVTKGCYWHVKGIEIKNAENDGVKIVDGSHNTFENCVAHHNGGSGFTIGYEHEAPDKPHPNPDGTKGAFNTFINCDAYNNFDWWTESSGTPKPGTNADGFAVKCKAGRGNNFVGCRAWANSDDAWDFYECGHAVQIINCWAWNTGVWTDHVEMYRERKGETLTEEVFDGNGNGFKIGGGCVNNPDRYCNAASQGAHVVRNCIAFNNRVRGFDQNNHEYGGWIENCVGFNNGTNFAFWTPNKENTSWEFRNNVSFGGQKKDYFRTPGVVISTNEANTWNMKDLDPKKFAEQFVSLSVEDALAPRGADGSLPTKFGRLKSDSFLIDRGVPTNPIQGDGFTLPAIPFKGAAPDLGAFENK